MGYSLKILQIYKDYYPPILGGVETHLNLLCKYLRQEMDVEVLVANRNSKTKTEIIDGIKVTKVGQWGRISSAPITPSFHNWIKRIPANIYHFHHPNPTAELAYLMAGSPGKMVVTYHSDIVRQAAFMPLYRPFFYRFLNKASRILPTSPNYIDSSPTLQRFKEKCTVVPLGIETHKFVLNDEIKSKVKKVREQYSSSMLVLFVGRLRYYKGLNVLIEAMQTLKDIKLLIIGTSPVPGEEQQYKNSVKNLNLEKQIFFLGEISDEELPVYYHACDVFCLPATHRSEAYGVVQLEAHACGKPVISTNLNTGVPFVNQHMKTGLIVTPGSVEELRSDIRELQENPILAKQLGEFAKQRVEQEFTAQHMVEQIKNIYRDIYPQ